ncbi:MAG: ABC transporter ATP-binding protein, partial [Prochlorococcus sp.]
MTLVLEKIGRRVGRNWIIRNLQLEVEDGECLALLGPSGCGKSSTLRLIAGLDQPDEGTISINGTNVTNVSPVERRIGMVFQSYALFPHLSVADNLCLGLRVRGASRPEQRKRVGDVLALMQLEDLAERRPSHLSGGQRQRVALARALLRDPLVYLLDEPMSNLDAQLKEELRPELRRLIMSGSQPVVYVTHDQHEAMAMAKKIAVLRDGQLEQV